MCAGISLVKFAIKNDSVMKKIKISNWVGACYQIVI